MSQDAEKVKKIIAFKQKLEKKIGELKSELEDLQTTLEVINTVLLEKGFKRAEIAKVSAEGETWPPKEAAAAEPSAMEAPTEHENVVPLTTVSGDLLAILYIGEDSLQVLPAEERSFDVNTPPFTSFLVERVLAKMQEKDNELASAGQIPPEKIFSYTITREGDIIREITIRNVDQERLRELKSSIRWTLEKMYEKLKSQN
jgi:hypothetical protein